MRRLFVTPLVLCALLLVTSTATAAEILRPRLIVRTYPASEMRAADWQMARREAAALLDAAGIETEWIECGTAPRCQRPLTRDEVAVRLVRLRTPPSSRALPLGESLIDPQQGSGTLATIYLDRVEWLARAGGTEPATVLGRAIAHELAHLLVGTHEHGTGLMRPLWTENELRRGWPVDWQFAPADAARMQAGARRRAALANIVWATE
jgi:hypothetical protein